MLYILSIAIPIGNHWLVCPIVTVMYISLVEDRTCPWKPALKRAARWWLIPFSCAARSKATGLWLLLLCIMVWDCHWKPCVTLIAIPISSALSSWFLNFVHVWYIKCRFQTIWYWKRPRLHHRKSDSRSASGQSVPLLPHIWVWLMISTTPKGAWASWPTISHWKTKNNATTNYELETRTSCLVIKNPSTFDEKWLKPLACDCLTSGNLISTCEALRLNLKILPNRRARRVSRAPPTVQ